MSVSSNADPFYIIMIVGSVSVLLANVPDLMVVMSLSAALMVHEKKTLGPRFSVFHAIVHFWRKEG
mgnify:CR=1 FL=1